MEWLFFFPAIFVFVLLKVVLDNRAKAREQNVRLLEEALKSPHIDRPTLETLTWQLTGHRPRAVGPSRWMALVLAFGWIALFVGIALWVAGATAGSGSGGKEMIIGGIVTAVIGFGFVTYPFALRELEARRQPQ